MISLRAQRQPALSRTSTITHEIKHTDSMEHNLLHSTGEKSTQRNNYSIKPKKDR